jgi:uncharacterized protein YjbI with pentapeptide repeats
VKYEIKNRWDGTIIYQDEAASFRALVEAAVKSGANLSWANLPWANLAGANLSWANLAEANLSGADLAGANLSGADLAGANLAGADLSGADLSGADLSGADLSWADLAGANLSEANLSEANLSWANLAGAPGGPVTNEKREEISETEKLRMQLAACGVAAMSNTKDTAAARLEPGHPYYSASYGDVCRAVDREMTLRSELDRARKAVAACHGLNLGYIVEILLDSYHTNTAAAVESASRYVDAAYDAPTENK